MQSLRDLAASLRDRAGGALGRFQSGRPRTGTVVRVLAVAMLTAVLALAGHRVARG